MWTEINNTDTLEEAIKASGQKKVVIFKHSTRCIISKMVLRNLEQEMSNIDLGDTELFFLDLIRYRNISRDIEQQLGVKHESPQMIVLNKEQVVHHASHNQIKADGIVAYA